MPVLFYMISVKEFMDFTLFCWVIKVLAFYHYPTFIMPIVSGLSDFRVNNRILTTCPMEILTCGICYIDVVICISVEHLVVGGSLVTTDESTSGDDDNLHAMTDIEFFPDLIRYVTTDEGGNGAFDETFNSAKHEVPKVCHTTISWYTSKRIVLTSIYVLSVPLCLV